MRRFRARMAFVGELFDAGAIELEDVTSRLRAWLAHARAWAHALAGSTRACAPCLLKIPPPATCHQTRSGLGAAVARRSGGSEALARDTASALRSGERRGGPGWTLERRAEPGRDPRSFWTSSREELPSLRATTAVVVVVVRRGVVVAVGGEQVRGIVVEAATPDHPVGGNCPVHLRESARGFVKSRGPSCSNAFWRLRAVLGLAARAQRAQPAADHAANFGGLAVKVPLLLERERVQRRRQAGQHAGPHERTRRTEQERAVCRARSWPRRATSALPGKSQSGGRRW